VIKNPSHSGREIFRLKKKFLLIARHCGLLVPTVHFLSVEGWKCVNPSSERDHGCMVARLFVA